MKVSQFKPWVGEEEYREIADCFKNNWITEGPKSKQFLNQLLTITRAKYGVLAPNGTLAIYLGLRTLNLQTGDQILVPDFTFLASASAAHMAGLVPVFVDVNKTNFQIDLNSAEKLITPKTKAIMAVHIYGTMAKMDEVLAFAQKHNLQVIEDAAQAINVHYHGQHAGTFGDVGCFSFFADKTLTTGEGGLVVTNDEAKYNQLLYLRNQGRIDRGSFIHPAMGYNFRMTDIQAAVGLVQLKKLPEIISRKDKIKDYYFKRLQSIKQISFFMPFNGVEWIPFRIGILVNDAPKLMEHLKSKDIETRTFFYPLHKQPCFSYLKEINPKNLADENFSNAIYGYEHGLCLPSYPTLTEAELDYVCSAIEQFYA